MGVMGWRDERERETVLRARSNNKVDRLWGNHLKTR